MISRIKFKLSLKLFLLPIIILIVSVLLNINLYGHSIIVLSFHSVFQAMLIYGVIALTQRWFLIRVIIVFFVISSFFIELTYKAPLSVGVLMNIFNTSPSESISFIQFNLFSFLISFIFFLGMIFLYLPKKPLINSMLVFISISYVIIPTLASGHTLFSTPYYKHYLKTGLARGYSESFTSIEYIIQLLSWRFIPLSNLRGISDTIKIISQQRDSSSTWTEVFSDGSPKLLVIGIGESLRADNLGIYGYTRNTTPILAKFANSLNIYKHTYAAGTNTWSSIPAALTKVGAGAIPDLSKSILNLAKEAGYETYWFSNQTKYSKWDFSVTSIAEQADHVYFSSDEKGGAKFDFILVDKLIETLKESKATDRRLIILNYYGSHMRFNDRYPSEFTYFSGGNLLLDQYDNSVLYTDFIQSKIINITSKYKGKYLFFADHGLGNPAGDIPLKHDVRNNPSIDSIKVPFFTYPKTKMNIKVNETVSLYYFECIFSEWAQISAAELRNGYCNDVLSRKKISFIDSNLLLHEISPPDIHN